MTTGGTEEGSGWPNPEAEETVVREILVPLAEARLELQLGDVGSADTKALAVIAVDAGVIGVLLATHSAINPLWPLLLIGYGAAALLLLVSIWPRTF